MSNYTEGIRRAVEEGFFYSLNVRANRPAEAGGVSLVCEGAEGAARQAYAACRSGSG